MIAEVMIYLVDYNWSLYNSYIWV